MKWPRVFHIIATWTSNIEQIDDWMKYVVNLQLIFWKQYITLPKILSFDMLQGTIKPTSILVQPFQTYIAYSDWRLWHFNIIMECEWLIAFVRICDEIYFGLNTKWEIIIVATNGSECQTYQNHNLNQKITTLNRAQRVIKFIKRWQREFNI